MSILEYNNHQFQVFIDEIDNIKKSIESLAKKEDIQQLEKLKENFKLKIDDFNQKNRKLNIGVVGQVKAGKSSFLNTLLFEGKEILPKASTPKTATLTKMEYSENNIIDVEYYSVDEWEILEDNAYVDSDEEIYRSAREVVEMLKSSGVDPKPYLEKKHESISFHTYEDLIDHLNDYVGEDGKFTPIVKAVTLYLNKEEFRGLSIVDTPGLNDPIVSRTIRTKEFIEVCDVVFFLSQSGSFLDSSDWNLLSSQLPQKGVKKLVLVASKYDSGVRDVLRIPDEDDLLFGLDDNTADNIPKACKIIRKKLRKRAKSKTVEFVEDLERKGSSKELIEVVKSCSNPILVSALAYNMSSKPVAEYTPEENNVYSALNKFSNDMESDLKLLGNIDEIKEIFSSVIQEKDEILKQKEKSFIPNAKEELYNLLNNFKEKANKRLIILKDSDHNCLLEQKDAVEKQINQIKSDITSTFGNIMIQLEAEKVDAVKCIRDASNDYLIMKERTGENEVTTSHWVSDSKWWNPFSWGSGHTTYSTHTEHYQYYIAADVLENLAKYTAESTNRIEDVFTESLQLKDLKKKLLDIVVSNFDMGSEKYDSSLFRIIVEDTVNAIEFPIFSINTGDIMDDIAAKFTGEISSTEQKTALKTALTNAILKIYDKICISLNESVKSYKEGLNKISEKVQNSLLENTKLEFEELLEQCKNKEKEIHEYSEYILILDKNLVSVRR